MSRKSFVYGDYNFANRGSDFSSNSSGGVGFKSVSGVTTV